MGIRFKLFRCIGTFDFCWYVSGLSLHCEGPFTLLPIWFSQPSSGLCDLSDFCSFFVFWMSSCMFNRIWIGNKVRLKNWAIATYICILHHSDGWELAVFEVDVVGRRLDLFLVHYSSLEVQGLVLLRLARFYRGWVCFGFRSNFVCLFESVNCVLLLWQLDFIFDQWWLTALYRERRRHELHRLTDRDILDGRGRSGLHRLQIDLSDFLLIQDWLRLLCYW